MLRKFEITLIYLRARELGITGFRCYRSGYIT